VEARAHSVGAWPCTAATSCWSRRLRPCGRSPKTACWTNGRPPPGERPQVRRDGPQAVRAHRRPCCGGRAGGEAPAQPAPRYRRRPVLEGGEPRFQGSRGDGACRGRATTIWRYGQGRRPCPRPTAA